MYREIAAQITYRSGLFCLSVLWIIFTCSCLFKVLNSITCSWNCAYPKSHTCNKAVRTLPDESVTNRHPLETWHIMNVKAKERQA